MDHSLNACLLMRQPLQQIPHMDLFGFDITGEGVHQKIDAAAQGELVLVEAARAQPSEESLDVACGPGTVVAAFAARASCCRPRPARCWIKPARQWPNEISSMSNGNWAMSTGCHSLSWRRFVVPMGAQFGAIAWLPPIQPQNGRLAGLATKDIRGHAATASGLEFFGSNLYQAISL